MELNLNNYLKHISALGSIEVYLFLILIFYALNLTQIAFHLTIGVVIIYGVTIPIRLLFFKERPKKKKYKNWFEKIPAGSFPSTHATRSTLLILLILTYLKFEIKMSVILSVIYVSILYSRIYNKRHDAKDVVGGMVLGLFTFIMVTKLLLF